MAPYFRGVRAFLAQLDLPLPEDTFPGIPFYNELATRLAAVCPDVPRLQFFQAPHVPSRRKKSDLGIKRYEEEVIETGRVPMREEFWHDFFNNLSWLLYPRFKMELMKVSYQAYLKRRGIDQRRSTIEDFTTMTDEASVLLVTASGTTQPFIFGHALFESALFERVNITAMTLSFSLKEDLAPDLFTQYQQIDRAAAEWITAHDIMAIRAVSRSCQLQTILEIGI
jgi:hypothetical protein